MNFNNITVEVVVNKTIAEVWDFWTNPNHITKWNAASEDWHTPFATNDLTIGGKFLSRMEAKDGSFGFDFIGLYTNIIQNEIIEYVLEDGRNVNIKFEVIGDTTKIIESFDAENMNPLELQKSGWQSILNNFKLYVESN